MSPPDGGSTLTLSSPQTEEDRMREALGLTPHQSPSSRPLAEQGRQSGRNGEVPVTVVHTRRPFDTADSVRARLATLTEEIRAERSERLATQHALAGAQRIIQQLQTKLAHTEIAAAEALEAEQKARQAAEARLLEIPPAPAPEVEHLAEPKRRGRPPKPLQVTSELAQPKRRGRPPKERRTAEEPEQEPVQWWLPSYKALKARRGSSKS